MLGVHGGASLVSSKVVKLRRLASVKVSLLRQNVAGNVLFGLNKGKVCGQVLYSVLLIVKGLINKRIGISVNASEYSRVSGLMTVSVSGGLILPPVSLHDTTIKLLALINLTL